MNQKERLVDVLKNAHDEQKYLTSDKSINAIADYLLEQGVIVPPCKVGQTVYALVIEKIEEFVVVSVEFSRASGFSFMASNGMCPMLYNDKDIGKTLFTSREDAEKALRKDEGK